jgi:hypothetical protein
MTSERNITEQSSDSTPAPTPAPATEGGNGLDLTQPRVTEAPTCKLVKPAATLNLAEYRIDISQLESNVSAAPLSIPVDKPGEFEWFQTHHDPAYRPALPCIDFEPPGARGRELHMIHPNMLPFFQRINSKSVAMYQLYFLMNRIGAPRICPVKLPGADGKHNQWHRTRHAAVEKGIGAWVRMWAGPLGYEWMPAPITYPDPIWPDLTMDEILTIAFGSLGRVINSEDHGVVQIIKGNL